MLNNIVCSFNSFFCPERKKIIRVKDLHSEMESDVFFSGFRACVSLTFVFLPQLAGGDLLFRYRCGTATPASLPIGSHMVSDGRWHSVLLEVNSSSLRLTLDGQHPVSASSVEPCQMLRSHGALLFGSPPELHQQPHNFSGCLEGLELNGEPIRTGDSAEWRGSGSRRVFGVYQCCSGGGACDSSPCKNGGVCEEDATGGETPKARFY